MGEDDDRDGGGDGGGSGGGDGGVSPELCSAYRETMVNQITGIKKDIEKVDSRTWYILAGIITSICIGILSLAMTIAMRG